MKSSLLEMMTPPAELPLEERIEELSSTFKCGTLVILQALRRNGLAIFDDCDATYQHELKRVRALGLRLT